MWQTNLKALREDVKYRMFSVNCMQFELFSVECLECLNVKWSTEEAFTILDVRKHQIRKT